MKTNPAHMRGMSDSGPLYALIIVAVVLALLGLGLFALVRVF